MYKSKDDSYMKSIHGKIQELSISLESGTASWAYIKKQLILNDLYDYSISALSYVPLYNPCINTTPDILFITGNDSKETLELYSKIERSMQSVTKNIHRISYWKAETASMVGKDMNALSTILLSEISVLQPKRTLMFGEYILEGNNSLITNITVLPLLENKPESLSIINQALQSLAFEFSTK